MSYKDNASKRTGVRAQRKGAQTEEAALKEARI